MSKKLFSTNKWKKRIHSAQLREANKPRRTRSNKGPKTRNRAARDLRYKHLKAPNVFSLIHNPEETISLLNSIEEVPANRNIDLDIGDVSVLASDAVAALTATIGKPKFDHRNVRGNLPTDTANQQILVDSGFFDHVKARVNLPKVVRKGLITQRKSKKVESATAADLIHIGTALLYETSRRSPASYRVLIESMGNTHNHAAGNRRKQETWWATVYVDMQRKRICYSFLDTGVGIFQSVKIKPIQQLYHFVTGKTDADILRDMLEGKVESSTGLPYRGRGLPSINTLLNRGELKKLVIITNNVYADVGSNDFRMLQESFQGTLLYWEV